MRPVFSIDSKDCVLHNILFGTTQIDFIFMRLEVSMWVKIVEKHLRIYANRHAHLYWVYVYRFISVPSTSSSLSIAKMIADRNIKIVYIKLIIKKRGTLWREGFVLTSNLELLLYSTSPTKRFHWKSLIITASRHPFGKAFRKLKLLGMHTVCKYMNFDKLGCV